MRCIRICTSNPYCWRPSPWCADIEARGMADETLDVLMSSVMYAMSCDDTECQQVIHLVSTLVDLLEHRKFKVA